MVESVHSAAPASTPNSEAASEAAAKAEQDANGTKVLVYVKAGVYEDFNINQDAVDMYFEDWAYVWKESQIIFQHLYNCLNIKVYWFFWFAVFLLYITLNELLTG